MNTTADFPMYDENDDQVQGSCQYWASKTLVQSSSLHFDFSLFRPISRLPLLCRFRTAIFASLPHVFRGYSISDIQHIFCFHPILPVKHFGFAILLSSLRVAFLVSILHLSVLLARLHIPQASISPAHNGQLARWIQEHCPFPGAVSSIA